MVSVPCASALREDVPKMDLAEGTPERKPKKMPLTWRISEEEWNIKSLQKMKCIRDAEERKGNHKPLKRVVGWKKSKD